MNREDQFVPHLAVSNGLAALEFYKSVFGAEEGDRVMASDGKRLMHGEIIIDGHKCFLSDEFGEEEGGTVKTPQTLGGTCVRITLMVDDADGLVERAVAAGARVDQGAIASGDADLSAPPARARVLLIHAREDLEIARQVRAALGAEANGGEHAPLAASRGGSRRGPGVLR